MAMASCKPCDGKPLVNGRESQSVTPGTMDLELRDLINCDLTWKKAVKGSRSSLRRARNSISRILKTGKELVNKDSNTVDMPVSESEELGVSVLGCHFSEQTEYVPIKKRKFMFRSRSPPPRASSPHCRDTGRLLMGQPVLYAASTTDLGQIVDTEHDDDEKYLMRLNKQHGQYKDFCGISMLADAACSNNFCLGDDSVEEGSGVEESFVHDGPSMNGQSYSLSKRVTKEDFCSAEISAEGNSSSVSAVPAEEFTALLRTDNSFSNSMPQANNEQDKSVQDCSMSLSEDLITKKDDGTENRLHWDLNTSMDAWGCPDFQYAESHTKVADDTPEDMKFDDSRDRMGSSEVEEVQRKPRNSRCYVEKELLLADCSTAAHKENIEELKLDSSTDTDRASLLRVNVPASGCVEFISTDIACVSAYGDVSGLARCLMFGSIGNNESLSSHQVSGLDSCVDNLLPSKTNHSSSTCISEAICDAAPPFATCIKKEDNRVSVTGEAIFPGLPVEEVSPPVTSFANTTSVTRDGLNEDPDRVEEISDLHVDDNVLKNFHPLKFGPFDDVRKSSPCQPGEVALSPSTHTGLAPSGVLAMDPEVQRDNVPWHNVIETGNEVQKESGEPMKKSSEKSIELLHAPSGFGCCGVCTNNSQNLVNSSNKKASDESFDNDYDSDVFLDDQDYMKLSRFEVDCDSQYEDGEVRESIDHTWEEYEGEYVEAEHVDYESDHVNLGSEAEQMKYTQGVDFHPCPSNLSGKDPSKEVESRNNIDNKPNAGPDNVGDCGALTSLDDIKTGEKNDSSMKSNHVDLSDGPNAEYDTQMMMGPKTLRRGLRSCIEGRTSRDIFRKDRDADDSDPKSERGSRNVDSFVRGRYNRHFYSRGSGGVQWINYRDSNRGIKHRHSLGYHGSLAFRYPGPESDEHQRVTISGSPGVRDEAFGMHMQIRPSRDWSPGRSVTLGRGRFVRYGLRVDGGGSRGKYHGPWPDDCTGFSLNNSHPLCRRGRSFSPIERRDPCAHRSHSKSPSRYRSRPPSSVNLCHRHQSKSPNFRSDLRMQRARSPHQRPNIFTDRVGGYRSMLVSHGSPPHNTRWTGDKKHGVVYFREQGYNQRTSYLDRSSSGRFGTRDDRFDLVDCPRNFRSVHARRFTENGVGRGGLRYKGNDDDGGKHGYRGGLVHPARRYDTDRPMKRYHYNVEDGFVDARRSRCRHAPDFHGRGRPKDHIKGIDGRIGDVPGKFGEDTDLFIYKKEGKHNVDSKSLQVQEGDDSIASKRPP